MFVRVLVSVFFEQQVFASDGAHRRTNIELLSAYGAVLTSNSRAKQCMNTYGKIRRETDMKKTGKRNENKYHDTFIQAAGIIHTSSSICRSHRRFNSSFVVFSFIFAAVVCDTRAAHSCTQYIQFFRFRAFVPILCVIVCLSYNHSSSTKATAKTWNDLLLN